MVGRRVAILTGVGEPQDWAVPEAAVELETQRSVAATAKMGLSISRGRWTLPATGGQEQTAGMADAVPEAYVL